MSEDEREYNAKKMTTKLQPDQYRYPRTSDYRNCATCGDMFAPITSNADDRYRYCGPECEDPTR